MQLLMAGNKRLGDPYWDNTVLHIKVKEDGRFWDAKGHTLVRNGEAGSISSIPKFGNYSLTFDGAGDYLQVKSSSDFDFKTEDFTIEGWIKSTINNTVILNNNLDNGSSGCWMFYLYAGAFYFEYNSGSGATDLIGGSAQNDGNWHHWAVTRDSGIVRMYIDGVYSASTTISGSLGGTNSLLIGAYGSGPSLFWNGYADDIRITKGFARYKGAVNFTPPKAPNPKGPAFSPDDILLIPFNGATGHTGFVDLTGKAITAFGNASISTAQSKFGGSSGYFDGTGDYLTLTMDALGTVDFTIEGWFYASAFNSIPLATGSGAGGFQLYLTSDNVFTFYKEGNVLCITGTTTISSATWYHVAVTRCKNTVRLFVNGVQGGGDQTDTSNYSVTTLYIGSLDGSTYFYTGHIDDLRITKGRARYTKNFDPPGFSFEKLNDPYIDWTSDPYVDKVSLHMPFNEALQDNRGLAVTVNGGAATSGAKSKFGGRSLGAPASGDYLRAYAPNGLLGSADFTIECWTYSTSTPSDRGLFHLWSGSTMPVAYSGIGLGFYSGTWMVIHGVATYDQIADTFLTSQWFHVALCRSGSSLRLFINGIQVGSTITDGADYSSYLYAFIDTYYGTSYPWTGYVDDLRITKGVARYTANFTPPAGPFASH